MKDYKRHIWFKPKSYTHFGNKLSTKSIGFIESYVSKSDNIVHHKFHPLINRNLIKRKEWIFDPILAKVKCKTKFRQIFYANHLDAHVYSYYANKKLSPLYEKQLALNPHLSDCICAYRRIPLPGTRRKKCNIDFANDVFNYISSKNEDLVAICFDVKSFFDSLNHTLLKRAWSRLLDPNAKSLPEDHFKIYRSLTKFVYVDFYDLLKEFSVKHPNDIIEKDIPRFLDNPQDIKNKIIQKGLLRQNPFRDRDKNMVGIPQGTPISAFLANLYLLEFDRTVYKIVNEMNGLYRRYSDDLIIVCKPKHVNEIEQLVLEEIKKYKLEIQQNKTQKVYFNSAGKLKDYNKPLIYLGFEYDGKRTLLKSSSLSKFHFKMKKHIAYKARLTKQQKRRGASDAFIFKYPIYKKYNHHAAINRNPNKRNYFSYAYTATKTMNEPAIKRQLSKAWPILNFEIENNTKEKNLICSSNKQS